MDEARLHRAEVRHERAVRVLDREASVRAVFVVARVVIERVRWRGPFDALGPRLRFLHPGVERPFEADPPLGPRQRLEAEELVEHVARDRIADRRPTLVGQDHHADALVREHCDEGREPVDVAAVMDVLASAVGADEPAESVRAVVGLGEQRRLAHHHLRCVHLLDRVRREHLGVAELAALQLHAQPRREVGERGVDAPGGPAHLGGPTDRGIRSSDVWRYRAERISRVG